ncbi:radical SAM protein [Lachnospiraceae bacterium C1.1]|nr:radical SAM protein [Lachnospiraceae bacterium C1.1]
MKYVIYGTNRVAKDFLYIFDELSVLYFIDDNYKENKFLTYDVKTVQDAVINRDFDQIIVCGFNKEPQIDKLIDLGMQYKKDYVKEEDFFCSLDEITIPKNKKIAIWGTGKVSEEFYEYTKNLNVDLYVDTYKRQEFFNGITVKKPGDIGDYKDYFFIIAIDKDKEIISELTDNGLKENIDFISYQKWLGMPSQLLRRTIFDESHYDLVCNTMLNHLEIFYRGNTRCCCTTFLKQNLDNIFDKSADDLWKSNIHKVLCLSAENKTFSFCDKRMCPLFVGIKKNNVDNNQSLYKKMSDYPKVLSIGHDSSCNLCCETCRKSVYFAKDQERKEINRVTRRIIKDYLEKCDFLILAGDGEVFASPDYKMIYTSQKCNPKYIRLLSNGTLLNEENWSLFKQDKNSKIMLTVSIDAATKETYSKIRKGNFEQLKKNLTFASGLRKAGELRYFRINFVVQRENYREMIPFVKWGEELGVDEVFFTKILNWGTYSTQEFEQISMMEKDGVTPKKELKEVLESDIIKNSNIVDLGTIQYSHKKDKKGIVENYYMWELEKRGGIIFE